MALRDEIDKASMFEEVIGEVPALQIVLAGVSKVGGWPIPSHCGLRIGLRETRCPILAGVAEDGAPTA
ncbi:MAG: hypothetical protein DMG60_01745 [Acidobacteria bacterium]|nr:MAG: hypothetical protein DMG60_01745 [Acidobacteriota bacterium]